VALAGLRSRVRAVRVVSPAAASGRRTLRLARSAWQLLKRRDPSITETPPELRLEVVEGFERTVGEDATRAAEEAIRMAREQADLTVDPVYAGRALAGLVHGASQGLDGPVLLLNTFHARGPLPADAPADWRELPAALHHCFERR